MTVVDGLPVVREEGEPEVDPISEDAVTADLSDLDLDTPITGGPADLKAIGEQTLEQFREDGKQL